MSEQTQVPGVPAKGVNDTNRGSLFNSNKAGWTGYLNVDGQTYYAYIVVSGAPEGAESAPTHKLFFHEKGKGAKTAEIIALFKPKPRENPTEGKIAEGSTATHWVHVFINSAEGKAPFISVKLHAKDEQREQRQPDEEPEDKLIVTYDNLPF